jgi:hypothetical protein
MFGYYAANNNVRVTLTAGIDSVVTSIMVNAATGFYKDPPNPAVDNSSPASVITIYDSLGDPTKTEIITYTILVNNGDGTYTLGGCTRGVFGSTAQSFSAGAFLIQSMTAEMNKHPQVTYTSSTTNFQFLANMNIVGTLNVGSASTFVASTFNGVATFNSNPVFPSNSITRAALVNGAAVSVIGRSAASGGAVADIAATADAQVLQLKSGSLQFSLIGLSSLDVAPGWGVIARTSNSSGAYTHLTPLGGVGDVLWNNGSSVAFGKINGSQAITANTVTYANLQTVAAKSVIGVAGNSTATTAAISGSAARQALFVNSSNTGIGFRVMDSGDLPNGNWIGSGSGTVAGSGVTVAADSTWYNTGASASLSAGTYLIIAEVRGAVGCTVGQGILLSRIRNATDGTTVSPSETICAFAATTGAIYRGAAGSSCVVTIASTKTIRAEISRLAGYTYGTAVCESDGNGWTRLTYIKLA